MGYFTVTGGRRLEGETENHGSKNGVLPILAAVTMCRGEVNVRNCPELSDVEASNEILRSLGFNAGLCNGVVTVKPPKSPGYEISDVLMRRMRSSVVFLGPMLARTGEASITYPGGCALGSRPIDIHLYGLRCLGADIDESGGRVRCKAKNGLRGAKIPFSFPSVGATQSIMAAACLADGETEIHNAAREPEVVALADFLNLCGAKVELNGQLIRIRGVGELHGCDCTVIPDRIEAATLLCAACICGGDVFIKGARSADLEAVLGALASMGGRIFSGSDGIYGKFSGRPLPIPLLRTCPYPGFPTDAQPLITAATCYAAGTSVITEGIFDSRFKYAAELARMGADIRIFDKTAVVEGRQRLSGAEMEMTDLRGGAALIIAALGADGESIIRNAEYTDRGYAGIENSLRALGAKIDKHTD